MTENSDRITILLSPNLMCWTMHDLPNVKSMMQEVVPHIGIELLVTPFAFGKEQHWFLVPDIRRGVKHCDELEHNISQLRVSSRKMSSKWLFKLFINLWMAFAKYSLLCSTGDWNVLEVTAHSAPLATGFCDQYFPHDRARSYRNSFSLIRRLEPLQRHVDSPVRLFLRLKRWRRNSLCSKWKWMFAVLSQNPKDVLWSIKHASVSLVHLWYRCFENRGR